MNLHLIATYSLRYYGIRRYSGRGWRCICSEFGVDLGVVGDSKCKEDFVHCGDLRRYGEELHNRSELMLSFLAGQDPLPVRLQLRKKYVNWSKTSFYIQRCSTTVTRSNLTPSPPSPMCATPAGPSTSPPSTWPTHSA